LAILDQVARAGARYAPEIEEAAQGILAEVRGVMQASKPMRAPRIANWDDPVLTHGPVQVPEGMLAIPSGTWAFPKVEPWYKLVSKDSDQAKVFLTGKDATVHIAMSGASRGTGVIVGDEKFVATANHVVNNPDALYQVHVTGHGPINARVVGTDPVADVALLKLRSTRGLPGPVDLIDHWAVNPNDTTFMIARPNGTAIMTEGRVGRLYEEPFLGDVRPEEGASTNIARVGYTNEGFSGTSGAGVYTNGGKVIAFHTHGPGDYGLTSGTASGHVQMLMDKVRTEWPFIGRVTVNSRALFSPYFENGLSGTRFDGVVPTSTRIIRSRGS
jgi:S1-C subfamily serine protease